MTIITAVRKNNEIAIACDTLVTRNGGTIKTLSEYQVDDSKLLKYGDSILGFTGSWAIKQIFTDLIASSEPRSLNSSSKIFHWLLNNQAKLKSDYFIKTDNGNDKRQPTESQWLNALLVNPSGIYVITAYREVSEFSKFWAIGSGNRFALGALEVLYEQPLSASEIAKKAALVATKFSPECSEPVIVASLSENNEQN